MGPLSFGWLLALLVLLGTAGYVLFGTLTLKVLAVCIIVLSLAVLCLWPWPRGG